MLKQQMLDARDQYISLIRSELLGPGSELNLPDAEHELISSVPDTRYSMGILFPHNTMMGADNDEVLLESEKDAEEATDTPSAENAASGEQSPNQERDVSVDDDDSLDEEISLAAQNKPSSMGISFLATGNPDKIVCDVTFATYHRARIEECRVPAALSFPDRLRIPDTLRQYVYYNAEEKEFRLHKEGMGSKEIRAARGSFTDSEEDEIDIFPFLYRLADQTNRGYVREPHRAEITLDFSRSDYADTDGMSIDDTTAKLTGIRRRYRNGIWSITIMLVNETSREQKQKERTKDASPYGKRHPCLFQPEISISTCKNELHFHEYGGAAGFELLDDEEKSLELQYRHKKVYATGLGTSADWEIAEDGTGTVCTEYFPGNEVPSMDFNIPDGCGIPSEALSMKHLSDLDSSSREKKLRRLETIVSAYRAWIDQKVESISKLEEIYHSTAHQNMVGCTSACDRMEQGLELLREDDNAWHAFELANRAMYMQRAHLQLQAKTGNVDRFPDDEELSALLEKIEEDGYEQVDQFISDYYSWRLFQIAFLLMSITSITRDDSLDRELVDLIWFPTGGGKTEAYLGLTAFTIFYRRLRYPNAAGGTTVMMRYTLRLLTAQQFTRASTLICACEYIRKDAISKRPRYGRYALGNERISIGLWIGNDHTPGKNKDAQEHCKELLNAKFNELPSVKEKHNKFQVLKCPWCGTKLTKEVRERKLIGTWGYRMRNNAHFELFCPQESCFFNSEGSLPIQIVDEELYTAPPSLLFATVDKFAMLPWKPQISSFFGINTANRAPELIIQDELHLISGPLGTMVGLYETAIDLLCRSKNNKTKIIASTATIRRAAEQCAALYGRKVCQYPHPALDAEDSFFAREAVLNHETGKFGRQYIGLMAAGKTKATMEVRTLAALLQRMHMMALPENVKDSYWTLTAYFNSLKELGKTQTLLGDDVKDSIKRTAKRLGSPDNARLLTTIDELTSRVSTSRLNETLDKLEKLNYSKENIQNHRYASNVLLATNMISVGIDVARLNVMLMVGQPKLTSEYIQASSRVGRRDPGIVFVMYDGARSRDRSHYEQFRAYHDSCYKYVEPTGATPFSKPARDRALHAVVIALLRLLEPELSEEKKASMFETGQYASRIQQIRNFILERNEFVSSHISPDADNENELVAKEIDEILEQWEAFATDENDLYYGEKFMVQSPQNGERRLLKVFNSMSREGENPFGTMTSMRSVDGTIRGNVRIWED